MPLSDIQLSPAHWNNADRLHFENLEKEIGQPKPLATGQQGMIAGNHHAFAIRSGIEVLCQGGSAADAACATVLAQNVQSTNMTAE